MVRAGLLTAYKGQRQGRSPGAGQKTEETARREAHRVGLRRIRIVVRGPDGRGRAPHLRVVPRPRVRHHDRRAAGHRRRLLAEGRHVGQLPLRLRTGG